LQINNNKIKESKKVGVICPAVTSTEAALPRRTATLVVVISYLVVVISYLVVVISYRVYVGLCSFYLHFS